jgi:hypothetical protein
MTAFIGISENREPVTVCKLGRLPVEDVSIDPSPTVRLTCSPGRADTASEFESSVSQKFLGRSRELLPLLRLYPRREESVGCPARNLPNVGEDLFLWLPINHWYRSTPFDVLRFLGYRGLEK